MGGRGRERWVDDRGVGIFWWFCLSVERERDKSGNLLWEK